MSQAGLILDAGSLNDLTSLASGAEEAGFHSVWATELYRTSFQQLAAVAPHTKTIMLGTAVALAFVRTPLITSLTSLDLDEASGGRLILGLGSGARRTNELWHGIAHGSPVKRISECVEAIRLITSGSHTGRPIEYSGEYYDMSLKGYHRPFEPVRERIPVYLAGIGPVMSRASGLVADGYIGHVVCSQRYLGETVVPAILAGLDASGRARDEFTISSIITCAISSDARRAREAVRRTIAFYATVRTYGPPFRMHGFEAQAAIIRDAFFERDVEAMAAAVTDEMVDTFAVVGTPGECRKRIEQYRRHIDLPILSAPHYYLDFEEVREYQRAILETFQS